MDERAAAHGSDLAAREEARQRERAERTRQLVDLDIVLAVQAGAAAEARHHQAAGEGPALREGGGAVSRLYGVSRRGYAPYDRSKRNQDALRVLKDERTDTQAILVLDGHGEYGEEVSRRFADKFLEAVTKHPFWATNIERACREELARLEGEILADSSIDCAFSGTTVAFAAVRRNQVFWCNVGDSRITLGVLRDGAGCPQSKKVNLLGLRQIIHHPLDGGHIHFTLGFVQRGNGGPKDFMGVLRGSIAGLNGAGDVGRAPRQALGQFDFKIRVAFGAKVTAETVNGRLADTSCLGKACDAQAGGRGGVFQNYVRDFAL